MSKKYLKFQQLRSLDVWRVTSKRSEKVLGVIDDSQNWKNRLVFIATNNIEWTWECCQQIGDFLKEQENV